MTYRYQLSRKKGWRKPAGGVSCARPSKYANPFPIQPGQSRDRVIEMYRDTLALLPWDQRNAVRKELVGKPLGCWCALDEPCHVDLLLQLANSPVETDPNPTPTGPVNKRPAPSMVLNY